MSSPGVVVISTYSQQQLISSLPKRRTSPSVNYCPDCTSLRLNIVESPQSRALRDLHITQNKPVKTR
ncbi:unnamed protein product [Pleuronectes platessa]|uniref:Uncharacterized protein n=1 Tax=Pleuronectes platessa TaxID=8262 RepID=A0A9N7ZCS6_PLEPL|nr:unnamed protein product [Pleuronectes platessa]